MIPAVCHCCLILENSVKIKHQNQILSVTVLYLLYCCISIHKLTLKTFDYIIYTDNENEINKMLEFRASMLLTQTPRETFLTLSLLLSHALPATCFLPNQVGWNIDPALNSAAVVLSDCVAVFEMWGCPPRLGGWKSGDRDMQAKFGVLHSKYVASTGLPYDCLECVLHLIHGRVWHCSCITKQKLLGMYYVLKTQLTIST